MLNKKIPSGVRLSAQFTQPRRNINVIVRAVIQHPPHPTQILTIATYMRANKSCILMARHEILQPIHDFHERRERRTRKCPIRMLADLLPTFVRFIDRVKERHRVSHMDQHWKSQFPCCFPNGTQAHVIHFNQLPLIIFDMQPKRFPDLQPLRARLLLDLEPARCPISESITQTFPLRPIHATKDLEAVRRAFFEMFQMGMKNIFAPSAIEINIMSHIRFIEQIKQLAQWLLIPATPEWFAKMIIRVNNRELWFINQSCFRDKF